MFRPSTTRIGTALTAAALVVAAAPAPDSAPTNPSVPLEQDDAGTGGDAGQTPETALPVQRGEVYDATLLPRPEDGGLAYGGGDEDWFGFDATAGESITVAVLGQDPALAPNCIWVMDATGEAIASSGCTDTATASIPADGRYFAAFGYPVVAPTDYTFSIDLGGEDVGVDYGAAGRDMRPDPEEPTVVVAVGDTGVNPYHEAYHRPLLDEHPCTWVAGFDDCSIPALELSIGEYDAYEEAYAADQAVWQSLEVGQWYWIPRTNIIGAVCDGSSNASGSPPAVSPEAPCIHDEQGHGTGTTSAVVSEAPNALLLVHEGNSGASAMSSAPVTPDIQSHSWGPPAPVPLHAGDPVTHPLFTFADRGAEDAETLFFIAAGNEAPLPAIVDARRVHPSVQIVGGGFPGKATTSSWSGFDFASWYCRPTAVPDSITAVRGSYCGTSFAAPTVAGTAAAALLELRRAEGYIGRSTADQVTPSVTRESFVEALRAAATYKPGQRYPNDRSTLGGEIELPPGQEHYFWGYGWLDASRTDVIVACATGGECPTPSDDAQRWNDARQELRRRQTEPLP